MLEAFPPRGIIRLLPPEHTSHGKPQIERLVAEEYILDTIAFFEGDRVQCAQRLASAPRCTCLLCTLILFMIVHTDSALSMAMTPGVMLLPLSCLGSA